MSGESASQIRSRYWQFADIDLLCFLRSGIEPLKEVRELMLAGISRLGRVFPLFLSFEDNISSNRLHPGAMNDSGRG
jgi:hypothetical protein